MINMPIKAVPVILCGGSGSRLWPLSRAGFPKQFLVLNDKLSLFQESIVRTNSVGADDILLGQTIIVTGEEHRFLALDHLCEMKGIIASILLEPVRRNTAPALTLAALQAIESEDDPILIVTPADQKIVDETGFTKTLQNAIRLASDGGIVILGVKPDKPETGYGYIHIDDSLCKRNDHLCEMGSANLSKGDESKNSIQFYAVNQFVEKPDKNTAQRYLSEGGYYWNSGIVVLKAKAWIKAIEACNPSILKATKKAFIKKTIDNRFVRPDTNAFNNIASDSIDYAVLEKLATTKSRFETKLSDADIKMVPLNVGWSDLGSWDAVWQIGQHDASGNVALGDTLLIDTTNTFVYSSSRLVGAIGVNNLVVVETPDAILVADKSQAQNIKNMVNTLEQNNRSEHLLQRKVHRPWGWYDSVDKGDGFKVKRIRVNPGASLSLQKHLHRAEHWVVVKGVASVICGEGELIVLNEGQSTYIPKGELHRLSNLGSEPLEVIEVQTGGYLEEDDIVRIEDNYGR
jgi:mannose-1-phosphate guanylyltransferase/mannose-6-phosphate isomerase